MTDVLDIEKYMSQVEFIDSHEDKFIMAIRGLTKLFPFQNAYFFRYSPIGFLSQGIIYLDEHGQIESIHAVHDDLRSLPTILSSIQNRRAAFIANESYISHSSQFPFKALVPSMLIIPVCLSANVAGYMISTHFPNNFSVNEELLSILTFYGKRFGKIFEKNYVFHPQYSLSKREIEVMQQLAYGYSVKEIAYTLTISEHTVQDYIKSAVRKTKAKNRLHAIVVLLRKGIIA